MLFHDPVVVLDHAVLLAAIELHDLAEMRVGPLGDELTDVTEQGSRVTDTVADPLEPP